MPVVVAGLLCFKTVAVEADWERPVCRNKKITPEQAPANVNSVEVEIGVFVVVDEIARPDGQADIGSRWGRGASAEARLGASDSSVIATATPVVRPCCFSVMSLSP